MKKNTLFFDNITTMRQIPLYVYLLLNVGLIGCKKQVEVAPPNTNINAANVFLNDATAAAVLTGIYANISNRYLFDLTSNGITSSSLYLSLSADELTLYNQNHPFLFPYYVNDVPASQESFLWNQAFDIIYTANSAIEGLGKSPGLTPAVKQELLGEAKFMRAFTNFYLVNVYGGVPLVLTTNWKENSNMSRASVSDVYQQIINDLKDAQSLLSNVYLNSKLTATTEKTRPNKWVATALLARSYLYIGDFAKSEIEASTIINNSLFSLNSLNKVFLQNSNSEAIWQLQPTRTGSLANTGEGKIFILPPSGPNANDYPVYLDTNIVNSFESGDLRKSNWIDSIKPGSIAYFYPNKYKIGKVDVATQEYNMVIRLAEIYLIRAEARAQQNKISEAQIDLNVIRNRAGLPNTTAADKSTLLNAIMQERKVELFTEWGHRWFDLKRSNAINTVMSIVTSQKGGIWSSFKTLLPIPKSEITIAPQLNQNPGY